MKVTYVTAHEGRVDPLDGLFAGEPKRKGLRYWVRGIGAKWKRHHHVTYERRAPTICSSGDSVPHSWGY